jgi:hypothetical protein
MRTERNSPRAINFQTIERLMAIRWAISSIRNRRAELPSTGSTLFPSSTICVILHIIAFTESAADGQRSVEVAHAAPQAPRVDDVALGLSAMTLRPRFAGDGRQWKPRWVSVLRVAGSDGDRGDVVGAHGVDLRDPFERGEDGLLLAESFARADLSRPRRAQAWFRVHGVVDLAALFPEDGTRPWAARGAEARFRDSRTQVLEQQALVLWHLLTLARLSAERGRAGDPAPAWQPHEGWDPAWAQPRLRSPGGEALWLGTDSPEDAPVGTSTLWVPSAAWRTQWQDYWTGPDGPDGWRPWGRLSADWHGLLELERRLIEPYVLRAGERELRIGRRFSRTGRSSDGRTPARRHEARIEVHEVRHWRSLLAPVYLQLFEAVRRVSEGKSGAALCRECGQPFLTLDARRTSFCNDRERFRFSQRSRRERLAVAERFGKGTLA